MKNTLMNILTNLFNVEPLWKFVKNKLVPPLGVETTFNVFAKYGYTYSGLFEGFYWDEKALRHAPEIDLWKMIAISETYWRTKYEKLYDEEQKRKDPARTFTINKILDVQSKFIIIEDTDGRIHGINTNGFNIEIKE